MNAVNPETGATALHGAASLGALERVKALVGCNADVNATDANQQTPLALVARLTHHTWVGHGKAELGRFLLENGADPRQPSQDNLLAVWSGPTRRDWPDDLPHCDLLPDFALAATLVEYGADPVAGLGRIKSKMPELHMQRLAAFGAQLLVGAKGRPLADRIGLLQGIFAKLSALCDIRDRSYLRVTLDRNALLAGLVGQIRPETTWVGMKLNVRLGTEDAIDAGGVFREACSLLADEVNNLDFNLFRAVGPAPGRLWPSSTSGDYSPGHLALFSVIGKLIGIVLMSCETLAGVEFAAPLVRMLLAPTRSGPTRPGDAFAPPLVDELRDVIDPEVWRNQIVGLRQNPEMIDELGMVFEVERTTLGGAPAPPHPLKPNGGEAAVTAENFEEYATLLAQYWIAVQVRPQIAAMCEGLRGVVPAELLPGMAAAFSAAEFTALLAGQSEIDPADWEANTRYSGTHDPARHDAGLITWFWRAVREMPQPRRRQLLQFCTGTRCPPARGFKYLRGQGGEVTPFLLRVEPPPAVGDQRSALPRAATCFNSLDLPDYGSEAELRAIFVEGWDHFYAHAGGGMSDHVGEDGNP